MIDLGQTILSYMFVLFMQFNPVAEYEPGTVVEYVNNDYRIEFIIKEPHKNGFDGLKATLYEDGEEIYMFDAWYYYVGEKRYVFSLLEKDKTPLYAEGLDDYLMDLTTRDLTKDNVGIFVPPRVLIEKIPDEQRIKPKKDGLSITDVFKNQDYFMQTTVIETDDTYYLREITFRNDLNNISFYFKRK